MERALTGLTSKLTSRKSTKDLCQLNGKDFPTVASAYEILDDCGRGVSATVHRARCIPTGEIVAVKLMNLESMNCDLDEIIHEAQTMRMYNHPNILPLYCSFVHGQELWMVMPFVAGGSVLHIMKYAHPEGLDEVIIATIGREVLKGLDYVHRNGSIHRDVKAGNILVDQDGNVRLGDFGVAASLDRGGSWGHDKMSRMTFVGTPCWMAPEVMEQTTGYDFSADIWSFGITLLEMCHGHAPFAKFPPMKVLLMTLQNPAPTLEDKGKRHFSKAIKDLVARCLQKEKEKRPTAAQLLEHKFFKLAKDQDYLVKHLLGNLPSLAERVQQIRTGKAATAAVDNDRNLEKSQEEYRKGVSSWNFDLVALKAQAALEPDDDSSAHGNSLLPTISESDEREDTLSEQGAAAAAMFVAAQQGGDAARGGAAGAAPGSYTSAFATQSGQECTAKTVAVPPPMALSSAGPSEAALSVLRSGQSGDPELQSVRSNTAPGEAPPPSPGGGISPAAALSREGSVGGNLGAATTPTAVTKQKKGRFEVSEHPMPSLSTSSMQPSMTMQPSLATTSAASSISSMTASGPSISGGTVPDLSILRSSTTGLMESPTSAGHAHMVPAAAAGAVAAGMAAYAAAGGSVTGGMDEMPSVSAVKPEVEESVTSVEPKQRGRFKIVAEQGTVDSRPLSKTSSLANLSDAKDKVSRSDGGGGGSGVLLGKPPPAPQALVTPVAVMLPKLQELLDHASAHQAALQKLIGAVHECDKGRVPLLLSRTQSTKSLFEGSGSVSLSGAAAEGVEDLRQQLAELRTRMSSLEEENGRLRERNKVLEMLHSASETATASAAGGGGGGHTVRFTLPEPPQGSGQPPSPRFPISPKIVDGS